MSHLDDLEKITELVVGIGDAQRKTEGKKGSVRRWGPIVGIFSLVIGVLGHFFWTRDEGMDLENRMAQREAADLRNTATQQDLARTQRRLAFQLALQHAQDDPSLIKLLIEEEGITGPVLTLPDTLR